MSQMYVSSKVHLEKKLEENTSLLSHLTLQLT